MIRTTEITSACLPGDRYGLDADAKIVFETFNQTSSYSFISQQLFSKLLTVRWIRWVAIPETQLFLTTPHTGLENSREGEVNSCQCPVTERLGTQELRTVSILC